MSRRRAAGQAVEMVEVHLGSPARPLRKVLCLGSHCDDIEIGCGGTILRLVRENPEIEIVWKVFSSTPIRRKEAVRAAEKFLSGARKSVEIHKFRDSYFPSILGPVKREFERLKRKFEPDLILTHYRDDLHQDHRVINQLTWNTFRHHLILEYEIPKYDGDLGAPNFFVGLDRRTCEEKAKLILDSFVSQQKKKWFTADTFLALQRIRGVECSAPTGFAEGFHCRKLAF
ncbi:MAG TPA: PIG-L deacetylase family protein [Candidatus Acidoferrum sp.]|nr:PIG-L deacetylase family protein [Candidatus Acidoferrum sp.]